MSQPAEPKAIRADERVKVNVSDFKKTKGNSKNGFSKKEIAAVIKQGSRIIIGRSTIDTGLPAAERNNGKKQGPA